MSKERDNYKALKMKKAEEKEIARKKEMENRIEKGIEALKYIIKNYEQRFQGILQFYVGAYSHDSNFFVSALYKAALFIEYIWICFSNYKLLDLKNLILNGEPGVIERVVAEREVQDFIGSNKELVAGLVKTTNGLSKQQRDSIVDLTNAMLKALQNRVEYNEFAKIVADGMERDGNRLVMVERLMKFALNKPDLKSAVIKIAQTAQVDIRKALWANGILKDAVKFMREHKDNEVQAFISQVEFIVRGDKNIPNDQKAEMIAYRAFRAICSDEDVQQRFFAALEKEKGISLTREDRVFIKDCVNYSRAYICK
ncbi:MAG: hypothetical protein ACRY3E_02730 [Candidatus Lariskella arthropodorum]